MNLSLNNTKITRPALNTQLLTKIGMKPNSTSGITTDPNPLDPGSNPDESQLVLGTAEETEVEARWRLLLLLLACEMMLKRKREEEFSRGVHKQEKRRKKFVARDLSVSRKEGVRCGKIVADAEGVRLTNPTERMEDEEQEEGEEERWYCVIGRTCYRH